MKRKRKETQSDAYRKFFDCLWLGQGRPKKKNWPKIGAVPCENGRLYESRIKEEEEKRKMREREQERVYCSKKC